MFDSPIFTMKKKTFTAMENRQMRRDDFAESLYAHIASSGNERYRYAEPKGSSPTTNDVF
jgi:hypothetical protein